MGNFVKYLLIQHFFDILFLDISWTVAQTLIKQYFLKEHEEVFQMDIKKLL